MLIFELSQPQRRTRSHQFGEPASIKFDRCFLRKNPPLLPEVSELDVIRHYTKLSQKNFAIDTNFYPLGSCSMKYNPKIVHRLASLSQILNRHPLTPAHLSQGLLSCLYELQEILTEVCGMAGASLVPMAGAQGELAGVLMIRAYHQARGDYQRTEFLIPDAAHGTNPASAAMCGYKIREIATNKEGDLNLQALQAALGPRTAGIMLTNPSTLGVFERQIQTISQLVHAAGGLLYYDGANLNAILGKVRPGDMGFDVMHLNLHKTFATPHGGGGPGAGPVVAHERLLPFLPLPRVSYEQNCYRWLTETDCPQSIGRLSTFMGNIGVLIRAYLYTRLLGATGMVRVADFATLNANYLLARLKNIGFEAAFPNRRASHEFILTLLQLSQSQGVTALHIAKRLLDYDFYAPTVYFPLLVPECLLIEPTETESKQTLDRFTQALASILKEAITQPDLVKTAPHQLILGRLDEVKAARELNLVYQPESIPNL